ncbi:hypothetical protein BDZ94DRAFT_1313963 [Collybia nuda]|uniref:Uncharacterized protein n=1 Tax=Collybia nuda TaxID=64659 RepID=A0A9P5XW55_9AGAR|nr:hypothetical protein BDZ94DRAFT_1313963 [Collybia nuda]
MEHVLAECEESARKQIWRLAEDFWSRKNLPWYEPSYGTQLGCALINFKDDKGKIQTGATRLYRILITESMHLTWKIRCEWKIARESDPDKKHSEKEVENRWFHAINQRLKFDCLMTDNLRYGRKALRSSLVKKTWEGTLQNEEDLPDNWYIKSGVLVGRVMRRPQGRNR